jgi:hypothetical protein
LIHALEGMLQDPGLRSTPESLSHLLADEFVEFGSSGKIHTKAQILGSISHVAAATYEMEDFNVVQLKPGLALATYVVTRSFLQSGESDVSLRSSIWVERAGRWQMWFHQGTIVSHSTSPVLEQSIPSCCCQTEC